MCRYIHVYYKLCPHTHSKYTPISVCPRVKESQKVCSWETARLGIGINTGLSQVVEEKGACDECSRSARKARERVREQLVGMGIRQGRSGEGKRKGVESAVAGIEGPVGGPKIQHKTHIPEDVEIINPEISIDPAHGALTPPYPLLKTRSKDRYDGREHHCSSSLDIPAGWCDLGLEM
ncbi:hypothetical protein BOTCAL_0274g00110 [Botryotinia calthae]|uniref:Uncharacterized protein n=1 Tax=Botryotinia calthae TaxID=38488 RepID=A0A4Y8CVN9_9HELO|nr:hypothetical protein BOTCAL_0274g00110 [Botryotinia calthae]